MLSATAYAIEKSRGIPCDYMICDVSDREQVYEKVRELQLTYQYELFGIYY